MHPRLSFAKWTQEEERIISSNRKGLLRAANPIQSGGVESPPPMNIVGHATFRWSSCRKTEL